MSAVSFSSGFFCLLALFVLLVLSYAPFFPLTCCEEMTPPAAQWRRTTEYYFNSVVTHYNLPRISYRKLIMTPSIMVRCVHSDVVGGVIKCCCVFLRVEGQCGYHDTVCVSGFRCTFWKNRATTK